MKKSICKPFSEIDSLVTAAQVSAANADVSANASQESAVQSSLSASAAQNSENMAEIYRDGSMDFFMQAQGVYRDFDKRFLGVKASPPTTDNNGDPLVVGAVYYDSSANSFYMWHGAVWVAFAFNELTPFQALGDTSRNLVSRFSDEINVKDFGAVGDGVNRPLSSIYATLADAQVDYPFAASLSQQLDWAGILKAILFAHTGSSNNYKPRVYIPAGNYLVDRLELNSLRGLNIRGEGSQDHTKNKTVLRYVGGPGDAAFVIKSCSYIKFLGIRFDLNNTEGLGSLMEFQGNAFDAVAPLNRFSSIKVEFEDCVFIALTGLSSPPNQTIWIKNAGGTNFHRCVIRASDSLVAVKLGADTDNDPVTGLPTFANGMATTPFFNQSLFYGRVERQKSRMLVIDGCDFGSAGNVSGGQPSRLTVSGNGETTNELFMNSGWDTVTTGSYSGILIDGGLNLGTNPPPCAMAVLNCQLGGAAVLVRCNTGDLTVQNCRGLPSGNITFNEFIRMEAHSGSLVAKNNNAEEYVEGPNSIAPPALRAKYIRDLRATPRKLPILGSLFLSSDQNFTALNSFEDVLATPDYFFGGQYVRLTYSLSVKHLTGTDASDYIARLYVGGTAINETSRTVTLSELDQFGVISCSYVAFIPDELSARPITLKAQQKAGVGVALGQIQGNATSHTTLTVELLTF
jgi:hypothetical protein